MVSMREVRKFGYDEVKGVIAGYASPHPSHGAIPVGRGPALKAPASAGQLQ
jgi:hypothetical protein